MAKPGTFPKRMKSDAVASHRLLRPTAGLSAAILMTVLLAAKAAATVAGQAGAEARIGVSPALLLAQSGGLLAEIGRNSQWVIGGPATCGNPNGSNFYSLAVGSDAITWTNGLGSVDIESIVFNGDDQFQTTTRVSQHVGGKNVRVGQVWTYSRAGGRIRVQRVGGSVFMLTRCS
jgi:hypothetical protein